MRVKWIQAKVGITQIPVTRHFVTRYFVICSLVVCPHIKNQLMEINVTKKIEDVSSQLKTCIRCEWHNWHFPKSTATIRRWLFPKYMERILCLTYQKLWIVQQWVSKLKVVLTFAIYNMQKSRYHNNNDIFLKYNSRIFNENIVLGVLSY